MRECKSKENTHLHQKVNKYSSFVTVVTFQCEQSISNDKIAQFSLIFVVISISQDALRIAEKSTTAGNNIFIKTGLARNITGLHTAI